VPPTGCQPCARELRVVDGAASGYGQPLCRAPESDILTDACAVQSALGAGSERVARPYGVEVATTPGARRCRLMMIRERAAAWHGRRN
jgi:hypothetical protein